MIEQEILLPAESPVSVKYHFYAHAFAYAKASFPCRCFAAVSRKRNRGYEPRSRKTRRLKKYFSDFSNH